MQYVQCFHATVCHRRLLARLLVAVFFRVVHIFLNLNRIALRSHYVHVPSELMVLHKIMNRDVRT